MLSRIISSVLYAEHGMATHHPSPPSGIPIHHGPAAPAPVAPGAQQWTAAQQMAAMNEAVWLQIGKAVAQVEMIGTHKANSSIRKSRGTYGKYGGSDGGL